MLPTVRTVLHIRQGVDWSHGWLVRFNGAPITVDWTVRAQVRRSAADEVLHEFATVVNVDGSVVVAVGPAESLAWPWRRARFDVVATSPDGVVLPVAAGRVFVHAAVTR